jgi:transposase-like protein
MTDIQDMEPLFDQEEAKVVEHIRIGGTMRSAAEEIGRDQSTLFRWLADPKRELFRKHYTRAREDQADSYADKTIEVAEDKTLDPADKRVRIDAYKWAAGKRKPKVYGDRVDHSHSGSIDVVTKEQRDAAVAAITRADS